MLTGTLFANGDNLNNYSFQEKTLVSNSNKISQIGLGNSLVKGNNGTSYTSGANKPKSSKIPSIRPAAQHGSMKSHQSQSASLSPHSRSLASPLSMHQQSKPNQKLQNVSSPMTNEVDQSMVSNGAVKVADGVRMQPMTTIVARNGSPYSGEGGSDVTHKGTRVTYQFDKEENPGKITCPYNQDGHLANESHSVSKKIQKENLFSAYETDCLTLYSPSEGQKISVVDIMDKKMSYLSLKQPTLLVGIKAAEALSSENDHVQ